MNKFKPITDKKIVDELEPNTTPIINLTSQKPYRHKAFDVMAECISWYIYHEDIDANTSVYKKWDKISELLGFPPIKKPLYVHRNALWAFEWKKDPVLIYYDVRGMSIQVGNEFKKDEIIPFLKYLKDLLIKKD